MEIKTIIITGYTGFIGSRLLQYLKNYDFFIIGINSTELFFSKNNSYHKYESFDDIVSILRNIKIDAVIHLATKFTNDHNIDQIESLIGSNILFGTKILELMRMLNIKYIIDTGTQYQHYLQSEYNPVSLYAATKESFSMITRYYYENYDISVINLVLCDTYGHSDKRKKLFNLLVYAYKNNKSIDITNGENEISILHVQDVLEAYKITLKLFLKDTKKIFKTYTLLSDEIMTLKDFINLFVSISNMDKSLINFGKLEYRKREMMSIWGKEIILPNWRPKISLSNGIREIISNN